MNVIHYIVIGSLATAVWALWVRRITWKIYWENAATATILLQAMTCVLMSPQSAATLGRMLNTVTGQENIHAWLAHSCCIASACTFTLHMLIRTKPFGNELCAECRRVILPVTVAIPVSLALLCKSRSADQYYDDFFTAKADGWLEAYWTTICVTILYLIVVLIYVLWELHDDSRQRWLSYMYMIAACIAGAGCMVRIVTVSYDPDPQVSWLFGSLSVIVFACGSGYSWLRKMRQFGEPFNPQEWSTQREELGPDAFHQHRREDNPDEPRQMNDP